MTVSRPDPPQPTPEPDPVDDQHPRHVEACDERHRLIGLASQVLGSWSYTVRLLVAATVLTVLVAGLAAVVLWLLRIDLQLGPVHLRR